MRVLTVTRPPSTFCEAHSGVSSASGPGAVLDFFLSGAPSKVQAGVEWRGTEQRPHKPRNKVESSTPFGTRAIGEASFTKDSPLGAAERGGFATLSWECGVSTATSREGVSRFPNTSLALLSLMRLGVKACVDAMSVFTLAPFKSGAKLSGERKEGGVTPLSNQEVEGALLRAASCGEVWTWAPNLGVEGASRLSK